MKITDCQPGSGNPTVRDERGAYGNVSYGGTRNPLHIPKGCRTETLCLRLRAPYFYPTQQSTGGERRPDGPIEDAMIRLKICCGAEAHNP